MNRQDINPLQLLFEHGMERKPEGFEPFFIIYCGLALNWQKKKFVRMNHRRWTFEYVLSGTGILEIDDTSYMVGPGDLYILPFGHNHKYYPTSPNGWRKIYINCTGPLIEALLKTYLLLGCYLFKNCGPEIKEIFYRFYRKYHPAKTAETQDSDTLLFCRLAELLYLHGKTESSSRLTCVMQLQYILDRSVDARVDLNRIARQFCMTPCYMRRLFKRYTGMTPYEYHLNKRIDAALSMLVSTSFTVMQIADQLHFSDAYHFSKIFKKKTGLSPRAYRNSQKGQSA